MARYGLLVDLSRCIGCYSCVVGCKNWHRIDAGEKGRIRLLDLVLGTYPDVSRWVMPLMCMQCDRPPCVSVCPTRAGYRRDDGIVTIDPEKCVGCELCTFACPYGARTMRGDSPVADGCDLCANRVDEGLEPYCVESCPMDALVFGDLDDPGSPIRKAIDFEKAEPLFKKFKTRPKVYYANIGSLLETEGLPPLFAPRHGLTGEGI
ncbi:MAG: 4Fe-4S dicluster domain-containing protein [Deltaproteobacteria bacterium]|nr:4Fe-4S dicluster domain-containing protein [Deltaproteobacteria bacterium]